jgi:hypothetical protein
MNARIMKFLLYAGVLPGLMEFHVNVDWPRFIVSMFVLAGMLWYAIYAWTKR